MRSYQGLTAQPRFIVTDNAFKTILPNIHETSPVTMLSASEHTVLSLFSSKESIVRKDIEDALSVSQSMAVRLLKILQVKGKIRSVGGGKNTRYIPC